MSKNILVVDDDQGIAEAVAMVLVGTGYNVEICLNARDVYKKISTSMPDLILLDILLSGEDGREIYANLKKDGKTKKIPVIVISAHHTGKKVIKLIGSDKFLAKPFEREELIKKITASTKNV